MEFSDEFKRNAYESFRAARNAYIVGAAIGVGLYLWDPLAPAKVEQPPAAPYTIQSITPLAPREGPKVRETDSATSHARSTKAPVSRPPTLYFSESPADTASRER